MNILFLGAGRRVSLLSRFKEAAERESEPLEMLAYEDSRHVPISPLAHVHVGKKWDDPAFCQDLIDIIKKSAVSVVIPCMDRATVVLSKMKDLLRSMGCWAVVSSMQCCETFENKKMAEAWFLANGIRTPDPGDSAFPVVAKKVFGFGSRGLAVLEDKAALDYWRAHNDQHDYMFQAFVPGKEFSIDAYVDRNKRTLGCVTRIRLHVIGGEVASSVTHKSVKLETDALRLLSLCDLEGPVTLQAIEQEDGEYCFIEVNPRFGGGVILSIEAGADYPRLILREALGRPVEAVKWEDGLLMIRSFAETFHHKGVDL